MELFDTFKDTFYKLRHKVYRYALQITGDSAYAEDVVQEVMIKAWDQREKWQTIENPEAWCMRVTRNHSIDTLRANRVVLERNDGDFNHAFENRSNGNLITDEFDTVEQVRMIVMLLPEQRQAVLHLRDVEGKTYQEIADITGQSINLVKVNLHRAREFVRQELLKRMKYGLERN
jgi:RNA polymerase sigma factor (sigma-70 family)